MLRSLFTSATGLAAQQRVKRFEIFTHVPNGAIEWKTPHVLDDELVRESYAEHGAVS